MTINLPGTSRLLANPFEYQETTGNNYNHNDVRANGTNDPYISASLLDKIGSRLHKIKEKVKQFQIKTLNHRIVKITLLHWCLLSLWLSLLFRFTFIYRKFYARTNLLATTCTNILLFGISDILAQSISCFFLSEIDPVPTFLDDVNHHLVSGIHHLPGNITLNDGYESDNYSVFNEYGLTPVTSHESLPDDRSQTGTRLMKEPCIIFNFWRWVCFMGWGAFISNFQVPWYKILNFFFTSDPTMIQVLERVLCDQLVYSPCFLFFFFTYSNYIMEGGDGDTLRIKIQRVYLSTLGCNLIVWPIAQIINFSLMPKAYQVPFSSSVGIIWNCFLSMRNSSNSLS